MDKSCWRELIQFGAKIAATVATVVPATTDPNNSTITSNDDEKSGRTVTITTEDMQRKKNDVKARTTLLLSLPDEHQLRFNKYKTTKELWAAILKTFGDKFWKKTGKKISIQGSDVAVFDKSKVECFNYHKMGHFARECRAPRSQERGRKDNYRQGSKAKEKTPKALMAIDGVGWDWSYMANEGEDHALVADAEAPTEFALMANTESKLETLRLEKEGVNGKLAGLLKASKNLDNLIESQRSDKVKDGVGYNAVPPSATDLYLSPKKDLSWTSLLEFVDDTVTDYSRLMPTIESTSEEGQNKNSSTSEDVASPITPKLFVKPAGHRPHGAPMRPPHRSTGHRPHGAPMRPPHRSASHRPHGAPMRPSHRPASHRLHDPSLNPMRPNMNVKTQYRDPWVPTVNRNNPPINRKFSTGRRNFPTANRKFPTGSTKIHTADMGRKEKAVKPLACWIWKPT
nr:hypothetical protein [Tanacetum cinerariifolium]